MSWEEDVIEKCEAETYDEPLCDKCGRPLFNADNHFEIGDWKICGNCIDDYEILH